MARTLEEGHGELADLLFAEMSPRRLQCFADGLDEVLGRLRARLLEDPAGSEEAGVDDPRALVARVREQVASAARQHGREAPEPQDPARRRRP